MAFGPQAPATPGDAKLFDISCELMVLTTISFLTVC